MKNHLLLIPFTVSLCFLAPDMVRCQEEGEAVEPPAKAAEGKTKPSKGQKAKPAKPAPTEPKTASSKTEKPSEVEEPKPVDRQAAVRRQIAKRAREAKNNEDPEEAHQEEKKIARAYIALEDFEAAARHMQNSINLQEKAPLEEYQALAQLLLTSSRFQPCIRLLKEAEKLYPDSLDLSVMLTLPLREMEKWRAATRQYEKIKSNFEAKADDGEGLNANFYFQFASAVERTGDIKRAAQLFQTCLERIPEDPEQNGFRAQVLNYLGYMWLDNDTNIDVAGELVKKAARLDPDSGAIADSVGWYYFKKGQYYEAMNELVRAEALMEEPDPVVMDHIAQTYHKIGKTDQAISYLKKAMELDPDNEELKKRLESFVSNENSD